ncbi:hypothetical protein HDG35_006299 [Paraburkholderia sp. JPY681]|nr:hypothetical protein [Paraburkholderia atlantica]
MEIAILGIDLASTSSSFTALNAADARCIAQRSGVEH